MDRNDTETFVRFVMQTRAMEIFQGCQIRVLQKVVSEMAEFLKIQGPRGESMPEHLCKLTAATVERVLSDLSDDDPNLASELKCILDRYELEPDDITG